MTTPSGFLRNSAAFQQALLQSERLRIQIVIATIGAALVIRTVRTLVLFNRENIHVWVITGLLIAFFAAYELQMWWRVNRALKLGKSVPPFVWIVNIVVETSLPAIALVFLSSEAVEGPYKPLANPAVLFYFIFIILSALRLNPSACRISGGVAAVTYLLAAAYLGWTPVLDARASILSPDRVVVAFALSFAIAGFVAGAVAGEIRKHLDAALREAETKSQVERLEHDLQIARSVQQSLLPKSRPQIAGFQVAGWNRPADDTGGDFYDWKQLPDGRWVMVLADVTGHGIGPAILASVCRAYSRASFNAWDNLETSLKNINHSFAEDLTPERFATFVAAVCQEQKDQLELLSAGHGPLLIYRAGDQSFQFLEAQTLPLGILPEIDGASPVKIDMKPGDIVLLITDGFFEWENPTREQFGTKRLAEVIRRCSDHDPETIIAELYDSVLTFAQGAPQKDDLTAVLIKRTGNRCPETV
jgi:serine phosphatase RsbU (regulator of sigma subunit)